MKLAHVIPNFHNPAGCTLSAAKRERLVELAAEHGFWIFEDDPYRLIRFGDDELPPTMLSTDRAGRVIHASSFSKTVSPGVRVGYLAGPAEQIKTLAKRGSEHYISPNMLAESMVLELCRSGALATNIEFVNEALAERRDALVEALARADPRGASSSSRAAATSSGSTSPDDSTRPRAARRGQGARASRSSPAPTSCSRAASSSLRLSFASVPADRVAEGVERLARALESVRAAERGLAPAVGTIDRDPERRSPGDPPCCGRWLSATSPPTPPRLLPSRRWARRSARRPTPMRTRCAGARSWSPRALPRGTSSSSRSPIRPTTGCLARSLLHSFSWRHQRPRSVSGSRQGTRARACDRGVGNAVALGVRRERLHRVEMTTAAEPTGPCWRLPSGLGFGERVDA